ncbi:MAG: hypothetical protein GY913_10460 [Proteobacteria bacterium]|nr:hypothetical protein [Pseudomonadota bacterium]MCP4917335.1 hypothetical protein [Pseudomonadota bacterium]
MNRPVFAIGAVSVLLAIACGGDEDPAVEAVATPPSAEEAPAGHHCRTDAQVRFACSVADGGTLNVCELETGLSVRLGPAGEVQFKYPPDNTTAEFDYTDRPIGDSRFQGLEFVSEGKTYALRELSFEGDTDEAGLLVASEAGDVLPGGGDCSGRVTSDWSAIERMHDFEFSDGPP